MSSSAIQVLAAFGAAAAAPNVGASGAAASGGEDATPGQQFAQLLGDSGTHADGDTPQAFARTTLPQATSVGSVVAQEIPDISMAGLTSIIDNPDALITPEKAELLMARVEQLLRGKGDTTQQAVLGHIKEQLQNIARGEQPKTLNAIIQAATSTKEAKFSIAAIFAMLAHKKLLNSPKTEEAPTSLASTVQAMPALIFRTADGEVTPAPAATEQETQEIALVGDSITLVTPLAATAFVVQPVPYGGDGDASASQTIRDMAAVIAPLKLQGEAGLPTIELPKLSGDSQSRGALASGSAPALIATQATKLGEPAVVISDKSLASFANLLNPSHSHGFSPTQTIHAPQPIQVVPTHGLVNQAPITDQVKLAVHQAMKDGMEQITVQLDPVDLGRVEVSMKTNRDGLTQISFLVDKPDTFDSLSRDARFLERALQDSGIKSDTGSMQFNLRQQPQPQLHSDLGGNREQHAQHESADDVSASASVTSVMNSTHNYILNIREGVDISA